MALIERVDLLVERDSFTVVLSSFGATVEILPEYRGSTAQKYPHIRWQLFCKVGDEPIYAAVFNDLSDGLLKVMAVLEYRNRNNNDDSTG